MKRVGLRALANLLALAILAAIGAPAEAVEPPPPDLAAQYGALATPAIVGEIEAPERISIGRAEIVPSPGSKVLVLWAAGQNCGWVLDGPARLVYRVDDRFSVPVTRRNLKRVSGVEARSREGGLELSMPLDGFAVWGWNLPSEAESTPVVDGKLPAWLGQTLARQLGANPGRDLLLSAIHGRTGYRWALLHGRGDDFTLEVDPAPAVALETLGRLRKLDSRYSRALIGRLASEEISTQPIGRAWWEPASIDFATVETALEVDNDHDDHASVSYHAKVQALRSGLRVLEFSLADSYEDSRGGRRDYRLVRLTVDGEPVRFLRVEQSLLIALPRRLELGQQALIEAELEGDILFRPLGDAYWRLGLESWYPKPGSGGVEWSSFRLAIAARPPFVPFASGAIVERATSPERNRVVTSLAAPMGHISVLAGKYETVTESHGAAVVHVSSYALGKEAEARRVGRIVLGVRACLETWLGVPYPFTDLQVIEVNDWGWGQAPAGLIFVTREAFINRASARLDAETQRLAGLTLRGINERIAHEVAHGWFPHVAKVLTSEEEWLSESFADYTSAVCLERALGDRRKAADYFKRQLADWKTSTREAGQDASVYLVHRLSASDENLRARFQLLYGKGPLVLHGLRLELRKLEGSELAGDRVFFEWVRSYMTEYAGKSGETRNLVALLERATGRPWRPWFENYVYGTETPPLE